ncbi:naphthalene 1,2-dioxygenase system ferredoxin component [Klebsiella pneumoniae]|nr:naphthalene 1,2-dioxygenase system ferredoxin component [Klebsiella pneumoniae]
MTRSKYRKISHIAAISTVRKSVFIDGEYYALEDVCPHAYALLSQGFVEDGKVECPLHEAVFDVKTGQCLHGPGGRNLNRYPVRVYDNQIQITFIEENVA